jgi:hypothetical protein
MRTARYPGGSNYISHDLRNSVISRYHLDESVIKSQLTQMRAAGMQSLGLPLLMMQGGEGPFIDWKDGALTPRNGTNLQALVRFAKSIGFDDFLVAPQFYNEHDLRQPAFAQNREKFYDDNMSLINCVKTIMDTEGAETFYDLCTEGVGDKRGSCEWYCQRAWTDWTGYYWPDGVICWDATISIVPSQGNISAMPAIFRGLDPTGPVNWPGIYNFHPYPVDGRLLPLLRNMWEWLYFMDLGRPTAPTRPWRFGETSTLTNPEDCQIASDVHQFVAETKQPIECVYQWPVTPRDKAGSPSMTLVNTMWLWGQYGM